MAEIHSSKEIDLALEAAILPQPNSILAWEKLLNLVEFEDLNNSILRIAPSIYKNLASNTNVSSYEKLKGSYRYNWAKNSKMFTGIYPVLKNLNQKNMLLILKTVLLIYELEFLITEPKMIILLNV
jgi:hypothetical protein